MRAEEADPSRISLEDVHSSMEGFVLVYGSLGSEQGRQLLSAQECFDKMQSGHSSTMSQPDHFTCLE